MTRYVGTNQWLDVDQQNMTVGSPGSPTSVVLPLSSLEQAQIEPTSAGGGVLTAMFAATAQPGGLVVPPQRVQVGFDAQAGPQFSALAGWLNQVVAINRQTAQTSPEPAATGPSGPTNVRAFSPPEPAATASSVPPTVDALVVSLQGLAVRFIAGDDNALTQMDQELTGSTLHLPPDGLPAVLWPVMSTAVEAACHDHQVTEDGEQRLNQLISMMGLTWDQARQAIPAAWHDLFIGHPQPVQPATPVARTVAAQPVMNALPVISPAGLPLVLKPGEVIHGVFDAQLLKQEVEREFRGGSAGFSFPLWHGVRMRTGGMRGHSVVVGTKSVVADTGPLIVTSGRVVFVGHQNSLEFPYPKLVGLRQYKDGLSLSVSNRQTTSVFQLTKHESPAEAVALISRCTA